GRGRCDNRVSLNPKVISLDNLGTAGQEIDKQLCPLLFTGWQSDGTFIENYFTPGHLTSPLVARTTAVTSLLIGCRLAVSAMIGQKIARDWAKQRLPGTQRINGCQETDRQRDHVSLPPKTVNIFVAEENNNSNL
ncbi:hypothetical protein BaRGS_00011201, partial [Batillaria attramentaria]